MPTGARVHPQLDPADPGAARNLADSEMWDDNSGVVYMTHTETDFTTDQTFILLVPAHFPGTRLEIHASFSLTGASANADISSEIRVDGVLVPGNWGIRKALGAFTERVPFHQPAIVDVGPGLHTIAWTVNFNAAVGTVDNGILLCRRGKVPPE